MANTRVSSATGIPPLDRAGEEVSTGGILPPTAADYGLLVPGQVAADATVAALGNRSSVPVAHVGAPVVVRLHRDRVRIFRDTALLADHSRAADGGRERHPSCCAAGYPNPATPKRLRRGYPAPLFDRKPRAQAMLYRDVLLRLGGPALTFLSMLSQRHRARLREEILAVYALYEQYGADALRAAMTLAVAAGTSGADALALLLTPPPSLLPLVLPGVPSQEEVDRALRIYEAWVQVDVASEILL